MKYTSWSVRQLEKRKNKPWQARLKYKDAVTGSWKETSKMLPDTVKGKREAKKLAEAWFDEMNEAASLSPNIEVDKTVEDMVLQFMQYQRTTGAIELSTYVMQLDTVKHHISGYIGDISFATLDRTAINAWLTKLYAKGLSQYTISRSFNVVRKVYNYYYNIGELTRNPFSGVKNPQHPKPKVTHLTAEQMDDYLTAVYSEYNPEDAFFAAALLLFYSGLRRGEVCGLRWRDVDLKNGTLSVETAIGIGDKDTPTYTKQPKNVYSIRTFPMVPQLTDALQMRYDAINPQPQWFVYGHEDGSYFHPATLNYVFKHFAIRNNLVDAYGKRLTPHMLRHNLGAVGIRSEMDIASLSRMFGHASRAMTLDTYGDATKDAMLVASDKLGKKFDDDSQYFKREVEEPAKEEEEVNIENVKNLTGVYKNYTKAIYTKEEEE